MTPPGRRAPCEDAAGLVVNASIVIVLGPAVRSHDLTCNRITNISARHRIANELVCRSQLRRPIHRSWHDEPCRAFGFASADDRAFRGKEGPGASDKVSDNCLRQWQTERDVTWRGYWRPGRGRCPASSSLGSGAVDLSH